MKKIKQNMTHLRMLLCVFFLSICGVSFSQSKVEVAHVDLNALVKGMPGYSDAEEEFNKFTQKKQAEYKALQTSLIAMQAKLRNDITNAQGDPFNRLGYQELEKLKLKVEHTRQNISIEIQDKENKLLRPFFDRAKEAVNKVA